MLKRTKKQIIIAVVFVLILSGLGFLVYLGVKPKATCFDGIQNQGEEGIDCGGPCLSSCLPSLKDIEVLWTKIIYIQDNFYDIGAKIKNPNQNYGSGLVSYILKLYDFDNNLIDERSGATFILPNQTKYLVEVRIQSATQIIKVEFSFGEIEWKKLKDYQPPQLVIQEKEYRLLEEQPGFSQASGILANKSNFDFDKVNVNVVLFDSNHQVLGLNITEINTLLADQERYFSTTWFNEIKEQVVLVDMEAETNIFDSDNFMRRYGVPEEEF